MAESLPPVAMMMLAGALPDSPIYSLVIGMMLIAMGTGFILLDGSLRAAARKSWETFGFGWLWSERLMRASQTAGGVLMILFGVLAIVSAAK